MLQQPIDYEATSYYTRCTARQHIYLCASSWTQCSAAYLHHIEITHVGHKKVVEAAADGSLHCKCPLVIRQGEMDTERTDGPLGEAPLAHGCFDPGQQGFDAVTTEGASEGEHWIPCTTQSFCC